MPVMDGITASEEVRKYETIKNQIPVPIIVITGYCAETEKMKCLDLRKGSELLTFSGNHLLSENVNQSFKQFSMKIKPLN